MNVKPIASIVEFLRPIADEVGVEIVDCVYDRRTQSLTFYIDAEGGVDLILCEKFHRAIDAPLDEFDPTFGAAYTLNCSSLGLDRPFKTEQDFLKRIGEKIEIHLYAPIDGKKYYEGTLLAFENGEIVISDGKQERRIAREKTSKVCLLIEV